MLNLPKPKFRDNQLRLFDSEKLLTSAGTARWATGDFFEEATAAASGAIRLRTDSRCKICPDLQLTDKIFFESKAVGRNGAVVFYKVRVEKDQQFIKDNDCQIFYWFWQHNYRAVSARTHTELHQNLAWNTKRLIIVSLDLLLESFVDKEPRMVNTGYTKDGSRKTGYGKNGTGWGWTIRTSWYAERSQLVKKFSVSVFDRFNISNIPVLVGSEEARQFVSCQ